jgi:hypothetical protein
MYNARTIIDTYTSLRSNPVSFHKSTRLSHAMNHHAALLHGDAIAYVPEVRLLVLCFGRKIVFTG